MAVVGAAVAALLAEVAGAAVVGGLLPKRPPVLAPVFGAVAPVLVDGVIVPVVFGAPRFPNSTFPDGAVAGVVDCAADDAGLVPKRGFCGVADTAAGAEEDAFAAVVVAAPPNAGKAGLGVDSAVLAGAVAAGPPNVGKAGFGVESTVLAGAVAAAPPNVGKADLGVESAVVLPKLKGDVDGPALELGARENKGFGASALVEVGAGFCWLLLSFEIPENKLPPLDCGADAPNGLAPKRPLPAGVFCCAVVPNGDIEAVAEAVPEADDEEPRP